MVLICVTKLLYTTLQMFTGVYGVVFALSIGHGQSIINSSLCSFLDVDALALEGLLMSLASKSQLL